MLKRLFDLTGSLLGLLLLSPVIFIVAILVKFKLGSPVFFRQTRPGCYAKPFEMIKFRTMRDAYDEQGNPLSDAERMTTFGTFLRSTSLDELPELWNVLKGDMSLVGPRPLLVEYLEKYTPEEARRHEVYPGITGWAQVNGRQHIPFSKRLELDVWYIDNWSFWLDVQILLRTVRQALSGAGVESGQNVDVVDDLGLSSDRVRSSVSDKVIT